MKRQTKAHRPLRRAASRRSTRLINPVPSAADAERNGADEELTIDSLSARLGPWTRFFGALALALPLALGGCTEESRDSAGDKVEEAGETIEDAADDIGDGIENAAEEVTGD